MSLPVSWAALLLAKFEHGERDMRKTFLTSTAIIVALSAVQAQAQETSGRADANEADTGEIIVTAQRRAESLQDVPVSLTAVTSESLASRNINDIRQINQAAPSVQIAGGDDGATNVFIRGVGTLSFAPSVESSVAIAVDDVNLGRSNLAFGAFDDVARVEALNGPQGLLFGKNASAGLLNIVTRKPELGQFGGRFDAEVDWRDTTPHNGMGTVLRGTLNVPVGATSALRINARYSYQDSVVKSLTPNTTDENLEDFGVRVKFLTQPSDNLELYLIGEYSERHGMPLGSYGPIVAAAGDIAPTLVREGIVPGPENLLGSADLNSFSDNKLVSVQGTLTYRLPNEWEIIGVTAYKRLQTNSNLDSDRTATDFLSGNSLNGEYSQFSGELRLAIPKENRVNGQLGLYYFKSKDDASRRLFGALGLPGFISGGFPFCIGARPPFGPPPACPYTNNFALGRDVDSNLEVESVAAFGQLNFAVTDQLNLIGGLRLTHDKVSIDNVQNQLNYFIPLAAPGSFSGRTSETELSWKLGAQYDINPDVMAYGYYARGYKGPGFNDVFVPGVQSLVRKETSDAFELGLKSSWLDGKLIFNLSAFLQKFYDYQAQSFDVANQTFLLQNAASLETKGLEAQLIAKPADGLSINANVTLLDATFKSFPGAECYPGQPNCGANNTFDASGRSLPGSAKFTSTVQAIYEFPVSGSLDGFVEANWYHRSAINFDLVSAPSTQIGAIDPIGASIGIKNENFRMSLFCRNCFDQKYPANISLWVGDSANYGLASGFQSWSAASVRNWGVSLAYDF